MDRHVSRFVLVGCLFLAVTTALVYSRAIQNPFVYYDDQDYVTENNHVQAGLTWETFAWAWSSTEKDNWHPLTWLSHEVDCQLYGLNPRGHHITSIIFHVLNVVLLFLVLIRLTGATGRSLLVAALFAFHPLNVESVAWIAERKNVLSTFFFFLGLHAYAWYAAKPHVQRYLAVAACLALGLASKPMVITFPFVLLLLDFWPLHRISVAGQPSSVSKRTKKTAKLPESFATKSPFVQKTFPRLLLEKFPLIVLSLASAIITIVAQRSGGAVRTLVRFPLWMRLENAVYAYAMYLVKAFCPVHLGVYYPYPGVNLPVWQLVFSALLLVSLSCLAWKYRLSRRYFLVGWLWYLGTMIPVIGIVQVGDQAMADRYAYLPLIGIFLVIVWTASDLADQWHIDLRFRSAVAIAVVGALALPTWRQIGYWHSDYDLWSHTLAVTQNNDIADESLGKALLMMGRANEALPRLRAASLRNPEDATRHANYGSNLVQVGRTEEAIVEYSAAIQSTSDTTIQIRCYDSLATLYADLGDFAKVRQSYQQALAIDPRQGLGLIQQLAGDAERDSNPAEYLQLGILLEESGQPAAARTAYENATRLDPSLGTAKQLLGAVGQTH